MIVAIRMAGRIGLPPQEEKILYAIRLRKKYACILLNDKEKQILEKVKNRISFGEIDKETLRLLIAQRGRRPGNKPIKESSDLIAKKLEEENKLNELGIKPFFSLNPPRGGFRRSTKSLYPRGILGENKNINEILRRML